MITPTPTVYSVNELNAYVKRILDNDENLKHIFVTGEISNYKAHYSGHLYMTIKDESASVKAVMFAGNASSADLCLAYADAEICALNPTTAVQFMYLDRLGEEKREDLEKEYILTEGSPFKAAVNGAIDDIIASETAAESVIKALDMMASKRVNTLDKKHSNMPY